MIVDIYGKNMNVTDAELQGADMTNSSMPQVDFRGTGLEQALLPGTMTGASTVPPGA
ncbi:hypothetical protein [Streptomyces sp. NPDC058268]|uniref:hypothetical protein n=1 Tax=Streptomyces sp. NPDC058268 TaxID=3346413 RepID=UPI0036EC6C45